MASKLENQIKYDAKVAELRGLIETEARKLQDAIEAKDCALRDVLELGERKSRLAKEIVELEGKKKEELKALEQAIARNSKFAEASAEELKKEKDALKAILQVISDNRLKMEELGKIVKDTELFVSKESEARSRFLDQQSKLTTSEKRHKELDSKIRNEEKQILEDKRSLDDMKAYLQDLYGKLAIYTEVAKDTIEYVNKHMEETGTPLQFHLPPGEILQVDFDNFQKLL